MEPSLFQHPELEAYRKCGQFVRDRPIQPRLATDAAGNGKWAPGIEKNRAKAGTDDFGRFQLYLMASQRE
jgi:hypothetical protein